MMSDLLVRPVNPAAVNESSGDVMLGATEHATATEALRNASWVLVRSQAARGTSWRKFVFL